MLRYFIFALDCNFYCSTRLEVFQYPERKNIMKIEEKRKKETTNIGQILRQSIGLRKGAPPPNTPIGRAPLDPLAELSMLRSRQVHYARLCQLPNYFSVFPLALK